MNNLFVVRFGINDYLPEEALICRHINNLLQFNPKVVLQHDIYHASTGLYLHNMTQIHIANLMNTYGKQVVLNVWDEMYINVKSEVKNG